jgi:hypothetical protein
LAAPAVVLVQQETAITDQVLQQEQVEVFMVVLLVQARQLLRVIRLLLLVVEAAALFVQQLQMAQAVLVHLAAHLLSMGLQRQLQLVCFSCLAHDK